MYFFEKYQSKFRKHHSTDTALFKNINDLKCNMESWKLSILVLLDQGTAFVKVDHHVLLNRARET